MMFETLGDKIFVIFLGIFFFGVKLDYISSTREALHGHHFN